MARKHSGDPKLRIKDEIAGLCEKARLQVTLAIPDAAAPIEFTADLPCKTLDFGITLKVPEDRQSAKPRPNWLVRQIKNNGVKDAHVRFFWPRRSPQTQHKLKDLQENPDTISEGKDWLAPISFHVFMSRALGGRFSQQSAFIQEIEKFVPEFYDVLGSQLSA